MCEIPGKGFIAKVKNCTRHGRQNKVMLNFKVDVSIGYSLQVNKLISPYIEKKTEKKV